MQMSNRRSLPLGIAAMFATVLLVSAVAAQNTGPRFSVAFPSSRSAQPIDGRLLLVLSSDPSDEPRMQVNDTPKTQMILGVDVDGMKPDATITVDDRAFGFPVRYLHDVPDGEYYVQVVLHRYETFHRADGHVVKLPMDRGEGQHWNLAPGNLYSKPKKISLTKAGNAIDVVLDQEIPAIP